MKISIEPRKKKKYAIKLLGFIESNLKTHMNHARQPWCFLCGSLLGWFANLVKASFSRSACFDLKLGMIKPYRTNVKGRRFPFFLPLFSHILGYAYWG